MPSLTIENYVKTIYQTCAAQGERAAATGQLAAALGVSPGTVTSMLKTLSDTVWPSILLTKGVKLTEAGRNLALRDRPPPSPDRAVSGPHAGIHLG